MKGATVYERGGVLYFSPSSLTTAGVWIGTEPLLRLDPGSSSVDLGESASDVLNASHEGVPHPTNWSALLEPLLRLAGVKSWTTFMKGAKCVSLRLDCSGLRLIPHHNLGGKEGYRPIEEQVIVLVSPSPLEAIGKAVYESLSRCK
jgi:hypothetical protein